MSITALTGFGATPSKPDFAFPKTVSKKAEVQLKTALKQHDGPATVRALLDYGLAQTAISPDKLDATMEFFSKTAAKVTDPATKAMIQLAQADAEGKDSLAVDAIGRYDAALKATPTELWKNVVNADVRFFPTLYDFAVAQVASENDSVRRAAIAYDATRPYPLIYLEMLGADDFKEYKALYGKFAGQPTAVYPLLEMARSASTIAERREAYSLLRGRENEDSYVKKAIAYLTRPSFNINANNIVARGKALKIKVNAECLNAAKIRVDMVKPTAKTVRTIDLTFAGEGVFEVDTIVELTLNDYGVYRLVPVYSGMEKRPRPVFHSVTVTDFLLSHPDFGSTPFKTFALDAINGARQNDVTITTDGRHIYGSRGADKFTPDIYEDSGYDRNGQVRYDANILTDRAIYHPGDTLRFAATLMSAKGLTRRLDAGRRVSVTLRNANYQDIDTLSLVSDDFGRISGSFALPKEGLTGRFSLFVENGGATSVMVTDYKAPTFAVEMTAERLDSATVELTGTAIGYNGFPIADAQVALTVNELPVWVWYRDFRNSRNCEQVATDTVTTGADGKFTARLTIPVGVNLSATATATSPTGESHDAQAFIPFYRYHIEGSLGAYTEAGKAPKFSVSDAQGEPVDVKIDVTLTADADSTRIVPYADWSNVPSGAYTVSVKADGAAELTLATTVYRRTDAMPPVESALFVPVTAAKPGDRLLVGTSYADSHIQMIVWDADSIIDCRWLAPAEGNFFIDVEMPLGVNDATMTLHTLRDYRFYRQDIRLSRPDVARKLNVEISALRDKMTPGDSERWTLRVTDNLGRPVEAALMLDVYSKALDALQPFSWAFNPPYIYGRNLGFSDGPSYHSGAYVTTRISLPDFLAGLADGFNLYGQSWPYRYRMDYGYAYPMARNMAMMKMADVSSADMAVEESAEEAEEDVFASVATGAAPSELKIRGRGQSGDAEARADDAYRLPELPVALWQPVLTTAPDGSLQIEFTAPNANTTWAVKALAYDRALLSGLASAEIVASKPVMVQPQLPRFLRQGDRIELRAMVMNNVDSAARISSFIEIFDPATEHTLERVDITQMIDAKASKIISLELTAPADASMIGVRVRATADGFTDGEQSVIPVLPNEVTVRTGRPLFIPANQDSVEVDVARGGTLTFTANAAWECVAALPGLMNSESRSALSAAATIFSAATARGLMRQHPEIGRALHRWEQEDSVLVSRLMQNEDLRIALLASTPFVNAAQSESEQRARLLLLFNNKLVDNTIDDAVKTLQKLVRKGGIAWTQNCEEPSEWITMNVLEILGQLKRMGYLPQSSTLQKIIDQAVEYIDTAIARDFAKNRKATYPDYVLVRDLFPEVRQSAPARRAQNYTVQHLVGHWRDLSLGGIARAAIILKEHGYPTTAAQLIESLRQHEAWLQMPLSPVLLNAFATVDPAAPEVDMIRSEYIARKQSMDWGDGPAVSNLVAAILNSGTTWLVPAANELTVKVDGRDVNPGAESVMGEFRLDLPDGGKVEITKGRFPAWGGVFSSAVDSITRVEAFASDKLKLTRTISGTMKVGEKVTLTLTLEAAQDMDYVIVTQPRCAALEPVDQLPSQLWLGYLTAYREPCATRTNWFFNRLAKGKTVITETFYVTASGQFVLAPAEAQSQYAPEFQSHTAGLQLTTDN